MITIVGVGALGSHAALFLRNEHEMRLVDFDRVEAKNTQAQFHSMMSLGKNKAESLKASMLGLFKVQVVSSPFRLTDDNSENVLKGSKLVVDCTDNIQARKVIGAACKSKKLPLLHGALSASGDFARIIWEEHFVPDAEGGDEAATCVDGEHLPFFAMVGAFLALEVQGFLKNGKRRSWQLTPSGILRLA